ncbi:MAG: hypothetical protein ACYCXE_07760 [Thermoleophilia bacterium]
MTAGKYSYPVSREVPHTWHQRRAGMISGMDVFRILPGYETAVYSTGREPAFIMMLAFALTFIIVRGYTRLARIRGWGSASFGGVHTHHLVFGIILAFVAGALDFGFSPGPGPAFLLLAAAFGCGMALVLDEFALVFHLQDVYWEQEGRKSIDAVVVALLLGGLIILQSTPFGTNLNDAAWVIAADVALNLPIVVIAALKGRTFYALFGIFIPTLALIGAIRLAQPDSVWSRHYYSSRPRKLERARHRHEKYLARWRSRKERVWDLIGGKVGRPDK